MENAQDLAVTEKRNAGLREPAVQTSEKRVCSPWGRGQPALPSQIGKVLIIASDVKVAA